MKNLISLLFFLLFFQSPTWTQVKEDKEWPVKIAFYTNNIGLPGTGNMILINVPVHPGIMLGTEFYWKKRPKNLLFQTADVFAYVIPELHYGFGLSSDFGYRHTTNYGVFFEARAGLAYLHTINYGPIYKLDSDGEYQNMVNWGRPHISPELGAGLGYNLKLKNDRLLALFMQYQLQLEYPFTIKGKIPILPHTCIFIGARFNYKKVKR